LRDVSNLKDTAGIGFLETVRHHVMTGLILQPPKPTEQTQGQEKGGESKRPRKGRRTKEG